jgi:hypothetical protein
MVPVCARAMDSCLCAPGPWIHACEPCLHVGQHLRSMLAAMHSAWRLLTSYPGLDTILSFVRHLASPHDALRACTGTRNCPTTGILHQQGGKLLC